jgi:hypothetical protein
VVICVFGWLTDTTFVVLGTLFLVLVIILTYLVGSCKVRRRAGDKRTVAVLVSDLFVTSSLIYHYFLCFLNSPPRSDSIPL